MNLPAIRSWIIGSAVGWGLLLQLTPTPIEEAWAEATPLARQGDPSPDGNGTFGSYTDFGDPSLNDYFQVAFSAKLTGSSGGAANDEALLRSQTAPGTAAILVREGNPLPLGGGTFASGLHSAIRQYVINNDGQVAFYSALNGTPGGASDNAGIFSIEDPGLLLQHARKGQAAPGIGGTFTYLYPPQINHTFPAGVSFFASNGGIGPGAIYVASGEFLTLLAYGGQLMPDGNGSIRNFYDTEPPAIRPNADEVAVWAHLWSSGGTLDDDGIIKARAAGISIVARGGNPAPAGGTYNDPFGPVINALGNCAFLANRFPVPMAGEGIYVANGAVVGGRRVVSTGQIAPDGNGVFSSLRHPSINADNLVAFRADLTGTAGGGFDDSGIFRDGAFALIQVVRENQAVPEGGGRFASFGNVVGMNDIGQVLFVANLRGTPGGSSDDRGLYLWDEVDGICKMLREGDVIGGQTVTAFSTLTSRDYGGYRCLDNGAEAVARVDCFPGGDGIYLLNCDATTAVDSPPAVAAVATPKLDVGPNPFGNEPLTLHYALPASAGSAGTVRLQVHDVAGRLVRTLLDQPVAGGSSGTLRWDGRTAEGRPLAAGVYFLRLVGASGAAVRQVVRITP